MTKTKMNLANSRSIFEAARNLIPGGVNSPVRAYKAVGGTPPHVRSANGAIVVDEDGNELDEPMNEGQLYKRYMKEEKRLTELFYPAKLQKS